MFGLTSVGDGYPRISPWTKTIAEKNTYCTVTDKFESWSKQPFHGENACLLTIERPNASRDQFAQCS